MPLRLSQGHLNLLTMCPRKFQHVVLDKLSAPDTVEQQERLHQGARFHLLLQQWLLELPIEPLLQTDAQLQQWFEAFKSAAPEILDQSNEEILRQAESDRTLEFAGYLLTVRYDLLISGTDRAKILDWKTYPRPQNSRWLEQNWQTRLYPFVLIETSSYHSESISMVYWFFQTRYGEPDTPQSLTVRYTLEKHEQIRQDLTHLLTQLTDWLNRYQAGEPFPQLPLGSVQCQECSFAVRCDRASAQPDRSTNSQADLPERDRALPPTNDPLPEFLPSLSTIPELPL